MSFAVFAESTRQPLNWQFFRIRTTGEALIQNLDHNGMLYWSNSISAEFLVEKTADLSSPIWIPHTRGIVQSELTSRKVEHFGVNTNFAFVPGGRFTMGDILDDHRGATPVHTVDVTPFFMKRHEVSNIEVRDVYQWAYDRDLVTVSNGMVITSIGAVGLIGLDEFAAEIAFTNGVFSVLAGKEKHPAVFVSWYGSVAFCNYLSMIEGKETCYDLIQWTCDFTKNGYRLPTEAEWEFAARGGYEGKRFPWADTDTITHALANYRSSTNNVYDVSPTRGFHPDYASQALRTSPVGAFTPNSYGLYDMAGNVWEWVWDWSARYLSAHQLDPTGPATGTHKVFRGGSNFTTAERCTCAVRYTSTEPTKFGYDTGFRIVTRATP